MGGFIFLVSLEISRLWKEGDFFFKVVCGRGILGSSLYWGDQLIDSGSCRGENVFICS